MRLFFTFIRQRMGLGCAVAVFIFRDTCNFIGFIPLMVWTLCVNGQCLNLLLVSLLSVLLVSDKKNNSSPLIAPLMEDWKDLTSQWRHVLG